MSLRMITFRRKMNTSFITGHANRLVSYLQCTNLVLPMDSQAQWSHSTNQELISVPLAFVVGIRGMNGTTAPFFHDQFLKCNPVKSN